MKTIFGEQNANTIFNSYKICSSSRQDVEIMRFAHNSRQGLPEYLYWRFSSLPDSGGYISIFIQNITENVLIEEEFTCITEQYETVNRDLCVAMTKLDFHLMDLEQTHKRLGALYRITSIVQKTVNEKEVLEEILNGINRELGFCNMAIFLFEEDSQELVIKGHRGYRDNLRIPLGQGVIGYAVSLRELVYVPDARLEPRYIKLHEDNVSEVAIPLIVDDKIIGVLDVETTRERVLQSYDLDFLRSLAGQIAITIAHAKHVAKVEKLAITDGLTGLYNYRYFRTLREQEFKRAVRYKRPLSQLMIDIDYFKNYNDAHGHLMGDEVLRMVAGILKRSCRDTDFVIRYGGEEFAVLLPETDLTEAYTIAEKIRLSIFTYSFPRKNTQPDDALTVSIGIAGYPDDAPSDIELTDHADAALYCAKRSTRNCVCIYQ
ncbi:GGDEF domain-containing protein [Lucifera butyrica]|uniref:GGDEF domain-containing protein n=1 Tax=Lucifera butyrica TaxID=1351585 RepID=UPI0014031CBA|nr:sensor domain-containing diguanylate cyclase [Lucifera butyrica]